MKYWCTGEKFLRLWKLMDSLLHQRMHFEDQSPVAKQYLPQDPVVYVNMKRKLRKHGES